MSDFADRFIKQHKEYFARNKRIIENNKWNDTSVYNDRIENFSQEVISISNSNSKDKEKKLKEVQKQIRDFTDSVKKNKESLFKQENELTNSILSRLSAFIKETEKNGERKESKVQKFIDETVKIIDCHIDKCDIYLDYTLDNLDQEIDDDEEYRTSEVIFQDDVFTKKIEIQDDLDKLNISGSIDNVKIEFFKDQKATIPMISVLKNYSSEIRQLTEKLDLPNEIYDIEFYIHKEERDKKNKVKEIPEWEEKKHYWEQKPETLKFWYNEWLKITKGFTVDGYFFHPWLYYHLNFYKTPIPQKNGDEDIMNPSFRDTEQYFAELLKKCDEVKNRGVLLYGSRRIGKSVMMSSICDWKALVKDNASTAITSGSAGDLTELTHKMKTSMKFRVPAFQLLIQKQEWDGGTVELGLKWDASTLIEHSRHTIKNLAGGSTSSTQKTAGGAPSVFLIEEIGKTAWEKAYLAAIPSFETPDGFKTTIIAVGTSGEASLSKDAMKAVSNPSSFKFLEMDWDLLEKYIPVEAITWKRRTFANFVPAQMAYKTGFKRIERRFGDFLGIESEYLNRITIHQTDWINNTRVLLEARKEVEKDALKLQQETIQYPIDPEECFLSAEKNPFPYMEAIKRKQYLIETGKWDRRRLLYKDDKGKLKAQISTMPLIEYPHKGGIADAPLLIFEDIPETPPVDNLYISSFDDVKQDDSDTDSLISFQIWKMKTFGDEWGGRLVLSWTLRPENRRPMYEKWLLLQQAYNAKAFPENEDMGYKSFLETKHLDERWLISAVDFTSAMNINSNQKRKYGWTPRQSKRVLLGLMKDKMEDPVFAGSDEEGDIEIMGVQQVDDIGLLEEIINYKEDVNVDRISAALGAVGWMHYLEINWILPKQVREQTEEEKNRVFRKSPIRGGRGRARL